jgi:hypothetical protein
MRTTDTHPRKPSVQRWVTPAVAVVIGIVYLVAGWLGGDTTFAVFGLALMVGIAAILVVARRFSETIAGLLDRRDERINALDSQATSFAGIVLISAVLIGFVLDIARGGNGGPYAMLGAIAGLAYVAALVVLRLRR